MEIRVGIAIDAKGNITFLTYGADGKPTSKLLNKDQMIEGFINSTPYRDWETDRKSTRLNSSHSAKSRMPSSA